MAKLEDKMFRLLVKSEKAGSNIGGIGQKTAKALRLPTRAKK